ncbi:MAG: helix-turn-helix transcriptional regulator, partial [Mycobacterium sp.]
TMSNPGYAEELARFAFDHGGGLSAALVLAEAMSWQGRGDEAEAMLGEAEPNGVDEMVRWGCLRAANLFWGCGQVDTARQILTDVRSRLGSDALIDVVKAMEVSFDFFSGDVATAIEKGLQIYAIDSRRRATVWAAMAMSTAWALALVGRFGDVHRIAKAGLPGVTVGGAGTQRLAIGLAEVTALTAVGDLSAAEHVSQRYAAVSTGAPEAEAIVNAVLGQVHLAKGALSAACAAFQNSVSAMSDGFPSGWLMLVAAWSAQAEGARGDTAAAAAAMRTSEHACGAQVAVFLPELELARAWERASAGETTTAQLHSVRAAQIARRAGMCAVELRALHTAVRFGDRSQASRLEHLAKTLNTPLAEAVVAHARGLSSHDGDLLDSAADRFAEMGAVALAADAAAQAAREHARSGHRGKQLESSTRAHWLASQAELRSPAVNAAARPLPITDREREIAMMVVGGLSNRQVADRLSVSVRTVDGHLYRIFAKLGIERRDQLVSLVNGTRTGLDRCQGAALPQNWSNPLL